MSNFFQEFKIADEKTCKAPWGGLKNGALFYCAFCGKQFKVGDSYKAIYTNDMKGAGGNPLCCWYCWTDSRRKGEIGEERMRELWKERNAEWEASYKGQWRWFQDHCRRESHREDDRSWQREINETARSRARKRVPRRTGEGA